LLRVVQLAAIGRDAHHRRHGRREAAGFQDLRAVEHVLHAVAQRADVVGVVLHLEDDRVIGRRGNRLGGADFGRRKGDESGLALGQRADRRVEAGDVGHRCFLSSGSGAFGRLPAGQRLVRL
jgi:hypothetical protein